MLLLLPCIAYCLLFRILREKGLEWRRAALTAAVLCGTCVVIFTEALSLPRLLTRGPLALCWLALCLAAFLYQKTLKGRSAESSLAPNGSAHPFDGTTRILLVSTTIIVLLVAITALVSAPNVWDAMEYHLPRATMWMSNHSVRFYATPDYAQLIFGPWAEFAMMHTELLWGSDRFVNLVEFLSFLFSAMGVSLIAKLLGAGTRGQVLAAIACFTIPQGILEASGPMNAYVVSFWIMATLLFLMLWNEDPSWLNTICVGLSAGLAVFTKGSAYIVLPFLVLACWWMGSPASRIRFLKRSAVFVVLILAINGPHYLRTYQLTGSPLGFPLPVYYPRLELTMPHVTPRGTAANVLRNISLHLGSPSATVNTATETTIRHAIRVLGVDPDDPKAVWLGMPFGVHGFSLHEIHAGNPVQLFLFAVSALIVYWHWTDKSLSRARWYVAALIAAFVFFSAMIQWQTWAARYHLPLFVLGAAIIGLVLERCVPRRAAVIVGVAMLVYAVPFAVMNRTRSLVPWHRLNDIYQPRAVLYFSDQHEGIAANYAAVAEAVDKTQCRNVAIDSYVEDPQIKLSPPSLFIYPLLALLHADGVTRTVWYTGVENLTARYSALAPHPAPCAVVCLDCAKVPSKWAAYQTVGGQASVFGETVVFGSRGALMNNEADRLSPN